MALLLQSIVLCITFTFLILVPQFKNPLSQILSYPPAIRQRVESLSQYQNSLPQTRQKSLAKKIIGTLLAVFLLAALAWFSGKTTFGPAFLHVFLLFLAVNLYDLVILDLLVFRHSKKVVIPGTEDMTAAYKNPLHHIQGALKGIAIGTLVALLAAGLVALLSVFP